MDAEILNVKLLNPDGKSNSTKFLLGATGSGKTNLMANLLLDSPRWLLFDTKNDFGNAEEFFALNICRISSVKDLADALNDDKRRIIFELFQHTEEMEQRFNDAMLMAYEFQLANREVTELPPLTICTDELNRFAESKRTVPIGLNEVVARGRDLNIEKVFGAQWFNTLPPSIRDSFSEIYVFRHSDKNGLALLENFGFAADEVKELPRYVCLHASVDGIKKIKLAA